MNKDNKNTNDSKPIAYDTLLCGVTTQENFKQYFRRLMRQLGERGAKVNNKQKPESYYQTKRNEFRQLIDTVIKQGWFTMPPKYTRIWRIYHDKWD